ncbi:MAG: M23 family metallopeptidase [Leptolyngbyaceae cyanobacterium CRU_2_3]|nr:M23 family metallopeptidase [Leptolyngbyaceae cyanobacterium CRU_2_3]
MVRALDLNSIPPQINQIQPSQPNQTRTPQTLALSNGTANDPQQPISQISPAQVAASANAWNGASFPVENFQAYTSPFGYRASPSGGYSQEFHYGLDMAAPEGSYIRNWWSGKVVEVSDNSNCGTSVVVESGNWTHIYCHMEGHVETDARGLSMIDREGGIQIYEGQQIVAGARIGRVGMSGRTTGPHLHWGLKYDNNWVDPAYVLQAMYSSQASVTPVTSDRVQ